MSPARLAIIVLCVVVAATAYGSDVQFHVLTDRGNAFLIEPPDLPRPANIVTETAYVSVIHPQAGMFAATTPNGTMTRFAPVQSGIDTSGFAGGMIRAIPRDAWDAADEYAFRDQPFGTMSVSGRTMHHGSHMPLAAAWNASYVMMGTVDDSRFGLGSYSNTSTNRIGGGAGLTQGTDGEYRVPMGVMKRAGLDFGPGTGANHTYHIYRGCTDCKSDVVIGHGSPIHPKSALPKPPTITDHVRGWATTLSCTTSDSGSWSGRGGGSLSDSESALPLKHSLAGNHYIINRYADLSVLPGSHYSCGNHTLYTVNTPDNRKHDFCVRTPTGSSWTHFSATCSASYRWYYVANNTLAHTFPYSCDAHRTVSEWRAGACSTSTAKTSTGYRLAGACSGGSTPSGFPPASVNLVSTGAVYKVVQKQTVSSSVTTYASITASCTGVTNTPHLNLADAMTVPPGLTTYRPPPIPPNHHVIVILDDTERGGGETERIQIFRGAPASQTGPYEFHLRAPQSGIMYDAHGHYGWVDSSRRYTAAQLDDMGYTPAAAMSGHGDGLHRDGGSPYVAGARLCHGDCFLGQDGIDSGKPVLRALSVPANPIPAFNSLTYDHINDRWFESHSMGERATIPSSYVTIPFAEDVAIRHVWLYGDGFDPAALAPSVRDDPSVTLPCHTGMAGHRLHVFADSMDVVDGDTVHIPILPRVRYVAFIGNNHCHHHDMANLPSPQSGVAAGARTVPLINGTILAGDIAVRHDGMKHAAILADLEAGWQSEMYGITVSATPTLNATWVVPPLHVTITGMARVNGADGDCGSPGVYCADAIGMVGNVSARGTYLHGTTYPHGTPYGTAPSPLPTGTAGTGVYGLGNGRCYGLESAYAYAAKNILIEGIRVSAGDTITLEFRSEVDPPDTAYGDVALSNMAGSSCRMERTAESPWLYLKSLRATFD